MPGLDPQVDMHHLNINPDMESDKQQQQRFPLEIIEAIKLKVKKFIDYSFIRKDQYPD